MTTDPLTEFERHFDDFILRFDVAYHIGHEALTKYFDVPPKGAVLRELEIRSVRLTYADAYLLLAHRIFGPSLPRDETWPDIRRDLANDCDEPIANLFHIMHRGRLAAFEITTDGDGLCATPIDGRGDTEPRSVFAVTDADWEDLATDQTYAGYLVDVGAGEAIILARPLDDGAIESLQRAAARSAWGSDSTFRELDYAEDVLAVLLDTECFDTGESHGRCFLDPIRCDISDYKRHYLAAGLREAIQRQGFPSLHPEDEPFTPRYWHLDRAPVRTQLAAAFGDGLKALERDLFRLRPETTNYQWYVFEAHPHQMRYLFPDHELIGSWHLQPDGSIDHTKLHRLHDYPLAATDLTDGWFHQTGAHPEWSIRRTLDWAENRVDDARMAELRRAVDHFRIALRWAALVDLHGAYQRPWIGDISYEDLIFGLTTRLPRRIADRRLHDFDEPSRNVWSRINTALRKAGHLNDDEPLTVRCLPRHYSTWSRTAGIGPATDRDLQHTFLDFARHWPESEGYSPNDATRADEASSAISDGLDELDDLF